MRQAQFSLFEDKKKQNGIYLSLEKIYIFSILLILAVLAAFIAGVKRGKHQVNKKETKKGLYAQPVDNKIVTDKNPVTRENKVSGISTVRPKKKLEIKTPAVKNQAFFSVQLASYLKKEVARIQAKKLKKKGILPILRNRGKYLILYAGRFSEKGKAEKLAKTLKKQFSDCMVVKLNP